MKTGHGVRDFRVLLLGDKKEVLCKIPITVTGWHRANMRAATYSHDLGAADFEVVGLASVEERIFSPRERLLCTAN